MSRRQRQSFARRRPSDSSARTAQHRTARRNAFVALGVIGGAALLAAITWGGVLGRQWGWSAPTIAPDLAVARVHGEPIGWAQVAGQMEAARVMGRPAPADLQAWREEVRQTVESIVGDVLTRHTMEAQGFVVTEAMIDAEVRKLQERYGGEAGLAGAMDEMQVTMADLRETQRRGLYLQALIDRIVPASGAEIDTYLAQSGATGMSRSEAAARVRAGRASEVIPGFLRELRGSPGIWVIDVEELQ